MSDNDRSSSPEPTTMKLVVKTPRQEYGDQLIDGVDLNWKVVDLKKHLSQVYPSCPVSDTDGMFVSS